MSVSVRTARLADTVSGGGTQIAGVLPCGGSAVARAWKALTAWRPVELPDERMLNLDLTAKTGREVVMFEVMPVAVGSNVRLTFEGSEAGWRQGIWIGTEGALLANTLRHAQFVVCQDTASESVELEVVAPDGLLRFYNVWDSGRDLGPHESQQATSGMHVDHISEASARYRCNDIGLSPKFDKLRFVVAVTTPPQPRF